MSQQELYRFVEGATIWCATSGDTPVTHNLEDYAPHAMGRTEVESKIELSRQNLEVSMGMDDPIARRWLTTVVDGVVTLTIFSKEAETGMVNVVWKGRLTAVKPTLSTIKLVFESVYTSLRRPGLRRRYQKNCPHVLYGRGCRLDKDDFALADIVTSLAGQTVTTTYTAGYDDGYFRGGMLQVPDGTLRFITAHIGSQLTLIRPIASLNLAILSGPVAVTTYPGCDRTRQVCNDRFNNLPNNGSTPFIPIINPFGGTSFA